MLKLFRKKGFRQFTIRTAVFFTILVALQLWIFLFFSKTSFFRKYLAIPTDFYFPILQGLSKQDFLNSVMFVVVAFLLWRRKDILDFAYFKRNNKQTLIFAFLAVLALVSHYAFKYWVVLNLQLALDHVMLITLLKYAFNLVFVALLAFSIYNAKFIKFFINKFYKDMLLFTVILFLYYRLVGWFQDSWLFFSSIVGKFLYFVFSQFFDNVTFMISPTAGPILGVDDFRVAISKVCSGIDSLLFFISLFAILVVINWKELDRKRMAILFIPGVIGTFLLNIIRVFSIIIMAVKVPDDFFLLKMFNQTPEQFAVDLFHTNIGWILFLGYFIIFWHFGSKWVLKNGK